MEERNSPRASEPLRCVTHKPLINGYRAIGTDNCRSARWSRREEGEEEEEDRPS